MNSSIFLLCLLSMGDCVSVFGEGRRAGVGVCMFLSLGGDLKDRNIRQF